MEGVSRGGRKENEGLEILQVFFVSLQISRKNSTKKIIHISLLFFYFGISTLNFWSANMEIAWGVRVRVSSYRARGSVRGFNQFSLLLRVWFQLRLINFSVIAGTLINQELISGPSLPSFIYLLLVFWIWALEELF